MDNTLVIFRWLTRMIPLVIDIGVVITGIVGVLGVLPFSIIGIIFLTKYSKENDLNKKNHLVKKGIFYLILPWALIICSLILLEILKAIIGTATSN